MKLIIFGATGRAGQPLLQQALQAGYEVAALVRTPEKLTTKSDLLTVIQGNIVDPDKVDQAVAGSAAVISVLGPTSNEPIYAVSLGMKNIIQS